jgi:hypothetical protein
MQKIARAMRLLSRLLRTSREAGAERRAMQSAKGPAGFDFLYVLADRMPIGLGQFENPFANRLATRRT